ncbi:MULTISPECIES: formyltransferase family protein [unclassified Pseudoalteromonas]|uniref:formyltransferase family protein n=1 Tax=unclassified Pseudoalteromonas TaxID=194690 RepID=UPI003014631B
MIPKFAVFTGSCLSLPAIHFLQQEDALGCVVLVDAQPNPDLQQLQLWLEQNNITTLSYSHQASDSMLAEFDKLQINHGLVYFFRHKIQSQLINYFNGDLVNIHPSPLPEYRGPQPIYWQLRNGEITTKLTLHKVVEELDSGDVGLDIAIDIHPFDTSKCLFQKVSQALPSLVSQYYQGILEGNLRWQEQVGKGINRAPNLQQSDLMINWAEHSATDIVNMARAGNTESYSAYFEFRQDVFQVLQATKVQSQLRGIRAGTIIELEQKAGLVVKTIDGAVRLDLVACQQGAFDGYRVAILFALDPGLDLTNYNNVV